MLSYCQRWETEHAPSLQAVQCILVYLVMNEI